MKAIFYQFPVIFSEIGVSLWELNKNEVEEFGVMFLEDKGRYKEIKPNVLYTRKVHWPLTPQRAKRLSPFNFP